MLSGKDAPRLVRIRARGHGQSTTWTEQGQPRAGGERAPHACYNPAATMVLRDWVILVTGTLIGIVSLTADLLGIGAFPGFGWKQVVGTVLALVLVAPAAWRIFRSSREGSAS